MDVSSDMENDSPTSLTDILTRVTIRERPASRVVETLGRAIAGPFTVKSTVVLAPHSTMTYEMRLRNLSSDCVCAPEAAVLSVRPVNGAS
jgi:hypothetical protein